MSLTYLVAIYRVVVLDGIHFSHGEGYCKRNDCNGNAVTDTLLEDAYIRCNRSLKSGRQKSLLFKDVLGETICQESGQGSDPAHAVLAECLGEVRHIIADLNPVKLWGILDWDWDSLSALISSGVSVGYHLLDQDQPQLILAEVHAWFCLLITHRFKKSLCDSLKRFTQLNKHLLSQVSLSAICFSVAMSCSFAQGLLQILGGIPLCYFFFFFLFPVNWYLKSGDSWAELAVPLQTSSTNSPQATSAECPGE